MYYTDLHSTPWTREVKSNVHKRYRRRLNIVCLPGYCGNCGSSEHLICVQFTSCVMEVQKQPTRGVLKICTKFTGEHLCRSAILIRHGCFSVNLLHIFRTPFIKNTSGWLLLHIAILKNIFSSFHIIVTSCSNKLCLFHVITRRQCFL